MLIAEDALPDLPIRAILPELIAALIDTGAAVLVAPPGTGKTTLVPLALATSASPAGAASLRVGSGFGRVVVAEPRRVAARAAARRMAELIGERVGGRVGYTVRGDRRVSRQTVVEVVTTGVLVRRLQRDPELAGTAVVILDECHERHLDSDLTLAFLVEVRAALRPDLKLLATSATAESTRFAQILGSAIGDAPIIAAEARLFPVDVRWCPPTQQIAPPHGLRVDPKLLDHVAATIRRALAEGEGDVLAFLPGAREIETVAGRLRGIEADVVSLHGRQTGSAQDAALRPGARQRVVLATAVAESSLTVPGVRAVVDAGLSRVPRMDYARGLGALVTVPVSRAAALQRAGRAGREAPGRVYRCWSQAQHDRLPAQPEPEIAAADLTGFALDLALWGHPDGTGLSLPDPPPAGAMQTASATLHDLGATDPDGRITARGRALADAGLHPRLARALLDGAPLAGARRTAEIIALLDDDRSTGDDLVAAWRRARSANDPAWRAEVRRLTAALDRNPTDDPDTLPDITDAAEFAEPDAALDPDRHDDLPRVAARDRTDLSEVRATIEPATGDRKDANEARGTAELAPRDPAHPRNVSGQTKRDVADAPGSRAAAPASPDRAEPREASATPRRAVRQATGGGVDGRGSAGASPDRAEPREASATPRRAVRQAAGGAVDGRGSAGLPDDLAAGLVVGLAYPERVARAREVGGRAYLMAGGTAAELAAGSGLIGAPWLAVASADRAPGARTARIRGAAPLDEPTAREAAATLLVSTTEIGWLDGDVVARDVTRLGAITLVERRLDNPRRELVRAALLEGLRREGLSLLTWTRGAVELRERLAFAHAAIGAPWPDVSDSALLEALEDWLELGTARRRTDLARIDVAAALRRLMPWSVAGRLDEVAPERLPVPSGSRIRVDYSDPAAPVLAVKVQEAFGWRDAPRLADGRVPVLLHLLSPAGRPVAVTSDLASFWANGYLQVRAEMRGRYPKHPWPEDPATAEPTRRTNRRS